MGALRAQHNLMDTSWKWSSTTSVQLLAYASTLPTSVPYLEKSSSWLWIHTLSYMACLVEVKTTCTGCQSSWHLLLGSPHSGKHKSLEKDLYMNITLNKSCDGPVRESHLHNVTSKCDLTIAAELSNKRRESSLTIRRPIHRWEALHHNWHFI